MAMGDDMATITGSNGNDTLAGGTVGNDLYSALDGRDFIFPSAGNDTLDGGPGDDVAIYDAASTFLSNGTTINNTDAAIGGVAAHTVDKRGFGTDTLIGVESFHGTFADDAIYLGSAADGTYSIDRGGNDLVVAYQGSDSTGHSFVAGSGNDTYVGSLARDDTIDYSNTDEPQAQGIVLSMTGGGTGTASDPWGGTDTFSGIERVIGTAFADLITGDDGRNRFTGGAGDDTLAGGAGDRDQLRYDREVNRGGTQGVNVDLAAGTATDAFGDTDSISGFEQVVGTQFNDTIRGDYASNYFEGSGGSDLLLGGAGDDGLEGNAGNDTLDGGAGSDNANYDFEAVQGVFVDLAAGTATDEHGDIDTLISIESVTGTQFNDTIRGNDASNHFDGRGGDDLLVGGSEEDFLRGGVGNDTIDGGEGGVDDFDRVQYSDDAEDPAGQNGVTVDLAAGTATDGFGDTDTLIGIENVGGTQFDDRITGDEDDNDLAGHGGNDTLFGGVGGDFLQPGAGNDIVDGGLNGVIGQSDTISYQYDEDATAGVTVTFTGQDSGTATDWSGGTDTFTGIEYVRGTHFADVLTGAEGRQRFRANGGNDTIDGGAGVDELDYRDTGGGQNIPTGPVNVDMVAGTASDGFGTTDVFRNIEDIRGSDFADIITGDDGDNAIQGEGGNDTIDAGLGANYVSGGQGSDVIISRSGDDFIEAGSGSDTITINVGGDDSNRPGVDPGLGSDVIITVGDAEFNLTYRSLDQGVHIDLALGRTIKQGGDTDLFGRVHQVSGSRGDDTIAGTDRDYEAYEATAGRDTIDGRGGFDELRFTDDAETGVTVDMTSGTATGALSELVTFTSIESIQGSRGADRVTGSAAAYEQFRMLGGDDTVDGGGGTDRLDYSSDQYFGGEGNGVTVDLAAGTATDALGDTDTFTGIEQVRGTDWDDDLSGDGEANRLIGSDGDDRIDGRAGADILIGGAGRDTLTGGAAADIVVGTLAELDGDVLADLEAADRILVLDDAGNALGANITTDGTTVFIDTDGDGTAEATMVNGSGYTGPVQSEGGPVGGGGPVAARITLDAAASLLATVTEGDSGSTTVTVTIRRSGDLSSSVTVGYDVAGFGSAPAEAADLAAGFGAGLVTFAPGQTTAQVTLQVAGDTAIEASEMLRLTLTDVSGDGVLPPEFTPGETYVRVLNDDSLPRVDITGEKTSEDSGELTFTVTREGPDFSQSLDVFYTIRGGNGPREANSDDVAGDLPIVGSVSFAPGQSVATITVAVTADATAEFHESLVAQITGLGGAGAAAFQIGAGQTTGEIRNDDGIPPVVGPAIGLPASSYADPHLVTFDGLAYDFQAVGEFTLVEAVSGDPLEVQVRYSAVPGSDIASQTTALATTVGTARISFDLSRPDPLMVDGAAVSLADLAGGLDAGGGSLWFDGEALTVVWPNGEQMRVDVFDGFLNVSMYLAADRDVRGLLGNGDGAVGNDLQLRDGTVLAQPVTFADLYGAYADSWRIEDAGSLFDYAPGQGTADFTDTAFPGAVLSLDDVPPAILAQAEALAAGIADPVLREAAIRDYLMSGNPDFISAAEAVPADPLTEIRPSGAPALGTAIGVAASDTQVIEGDEGLTTIVYSVYRTGPTDGTLDVGYRIDGPDGQTATGTLQFAPGQSVLAVTWDIEGDLVSEGLQEAVITLLPGSGVTVINSQAITEVLDDDLAPVARTDRFAATEDAVLTGNLLADNGAGADTGETALSITALIAPDGTELAVGQTHVFDFGTVRVEADGSFTLNSNGPAFDGLGQGQTAELGLGYVLSDGTNSSAGDIRVTVAGQDEFPDLNVINGTRRNDMLRGTSGDDLIHGRGGNDVMNGRGGEDWFVFGAETENHRRETDVIFGFSAAEDTIVLDGTEILSVRDTCYGVFIRFADDRDVLHVLGEGVTADTIRIVEADDLTWWA